MNWHGRKKSDQLYDFNYTFRRTMQLILDETVVAFQQFLNNSSTMDLQFEKHYEKTADSQSVKGSVAARSKEDSKRTRNGQPVENLTDFFRLHFRGSKYFQLPF